MKSLTFREAFARFQAACAGQWRPSTQTQYDQTNARVFSPTLGPRALNGIKGEDIQCLLGSLKVRSATRRLYAAYLSAFFNWAINNDLALKNPLRGLAFPLTDQNPVFPLTLDEAYRILTAAKKGSSIPQYPILAVGLYTGLRAANVIGLQQTHILWDRGLLSFGGGEMKGRQPFIAPFHPALEGYLKMVPFKVAPRTLRYICERVAQRASVPRFHFHLLRHTFASWMAQVAPEAVLTALLGHRTSRNNITSLYVHVTLEQMKEALLKLPMLL